MKILIKDGRIIDHQNNFIADILIEDSLILSIGPDIRTEADIVIDANNMTVMPSFIDLHAHLRDPGFTYKEDLKTGAEAALKGGYTVLYAMGNTNPVCDSIQIHDDIISRNDELDLIDLYQIITVTKELKGEELTDFSNFSDRVKFISDDGKGILSNYLMYEACKLASENNIGIMVHAEDPEISPVDYRIAEDLITIRDIYLSKATECKVHFSHVSTRGSIEAIREGKKDNSLLTCEVTPHHILLHDSDFRVNPPIRTKDDIESIIEGIKDGTVDAIATDHAPHTEEDKESGAPGMIGLETAFMISYTKLVKGGHIDLKELSKLMSYNPGKIIGINHGEIKPGEKANLVIIDLDKKIIVDSHTFKSKSKNSPFYGYELYGSIEKTIRNGKIMYDGGRI